MALPSTILDKDGKELYSFFDERRVPVTFNEIDPLMIDALVSAEDKDFWSNDGFDPRGMMRSVSVLIQEWRDHGLFTYSQGASTLTQQIIKNNVVGKEKKLQRKLHEIIHAWLLTYNTYAVNKESMSDTDDVSIREKTKQDILTYYLNTTFFGNNAYGIYEAARIYFGKTPDDLTLSQAAVLAAIPKSPYYLDPYKFRNNVVGNWEISIDRGKPYPIDPEKYGNLLSTMIITGYVVDRSQDLVSLLPTFSGMVQQDDGTYRHWYISYSAGRKDYVIQRLREDGKIELEEALLAIVTPMEFQDKATVLNTISAPHFVHYIKGEILGLTHLGINEQQLSQGGYTIYTSLDSALQSKLETQVRNHMESSYQRWANNRAVLVTSMKNGEILAYLGSKNYFQADIEGQVDMIAHPRQVGSVLKPLIYAYAMTHYPIGMDTIIKDVRTTYPGYTPNNADGLFKWNIPLKQALARSRNIPAIRLFNALWWADVLVPYFKSLGMKHLHDPSEYGLSMALGTAPMSMLDLTQGFLQMTDQPDVPLLHGITKIVDKKWFVVYEAGMLNQSRTIPLGVAKIITNILSSTKYAPSYFHDMIHMNLCDSCASKTGTTNMKVKKKNVARDGLLLTYNPDILLLMRAGNTNAQWLAANAYGYNLNTILRNDIFKILLNSEYTSEHSKRKYPTNQTTTKKGHGEVYKSPTNAVIPTTMLQKL